MIKYKRILLKLSGEAFMGSQSYGIDETILNEYADQVNELQVMGVQIAIVIGGGNIFRGLKGTKLGFDRVTGDQMGMLATVINSLALCSALNKTGSKARVFTSIRMEPVGEYYSREKATEALNNGEIVIIAGGTGNPYFTTDTASALRAVETGAEIMFKGTRVDGVYSDDPEKNSNAKKYDHISFDEVYKQNLRVMDLTAITLCKENNLPVLVFNMNKKGTLKKAVSGENTGTLVTKAI
jgi:uridylate kinase